MFASQQDSLDGTELKPGNCFDDEGWAMTGRRERLVLSGTFVTFKCSTTWKLIFLGIIYDHSVKNNIATHIT